MAQKKKTVPNLREVDISKKCIYINRMAYFLKAEKDVSVKKGPDEFSMFVPINSKKAGEGSGIIVAYSSEGTKDGSVIFTFPWPIDEEILFEVYEHLNDLTLNWRYSKFCVNSGGRVCLSIDFPFENSDVEQQTNVFMDLMVKFIDAKYDEIRDLLCGDSDSEDEPTGKKIMEMPLPF